MSGTGRGVPLTLDTSAQDQSLAVKRGQLKGLNSHIAIISDDPLPGEPTEFFRDASTSMRIFIPTIRFAGAISACGSSSFSHLP